MSNRSQQRPRVEQGDSQAHDGKLPEIVCIQESKAVLPQPPKEQKLPILPHEHRFSDTSIFGKSFGSCLFENSWKNAVINTRRIKQKYGLRNCDENALIPKLTQGSERHSAIKDPSVAQKTQGAANSFSYSNNDSGLPPLGLLQCPSSQFSFGNLYKSRGEIAMGDINKRGTCSWKQNSMKTSGVHDGAGEIGAVRLKKHNRYSSLVSAPDGSKFNSGYNFPDPVQGAPPQYLQRLSELAALECETVHQEKCRKFRKMKKPI